LLNSKLKKNNAFTFLEEGLEPEDFFEDLDEEKGKVENEQFQFSGSSVYECAPTLNGDYRAINIGSIGDPFLADDLLNCFYTMIFEFNNAYYVWYPKPPSEREKKSALATVDTIIYGDADDLTDEKKEEMKKKFKISEINAGEEPRKFKHFFPSWPKKRQYVDKFEVERIKKEKEYQEKIQLAYPFLDRMRLKYQGYLTDDENVNVHNIVTLFTIGEVKRDWTTFLSAITQLSTDKFKYDEGFIAEFYKFVLEQTKGAKKVVKKKESSDDEHSEDDEAKPKKVQEEMTDSEEDEPKKIVKKVEKVMTDSDEDEPPKKAAPKKNINFSDSD